MKLKPLRPEGRRLLSQFVKNQNLNVFPKCKLDSPLTTNLKHLDLSENAFQQFPESILLFENLNTLFLNNNQLSKIPDSINKLNSLEHLDLRHNKFNQFPTNILQKLPSLKHLNIDHFYETPFYFDQTKTSEVYAFLDAINESPSLKSISVNSALKDEWFPKYFFSAKSGLCKTYVMDD